MNMDKERIAAVIRLLRKQRGWESQDLARVAGLSVGTISRIENLHNFPTLETISKIAAAFDMTATELCSRIEDIEISIGGGRVSEGTADYDAIAERAAQRTLEKLVATIGPKTSEEED